MKIIYSIGYSGFPVDEFVAELKRRRITALVDVRSSPHSGYYTDFNREALAPRLRREGIVYRNYAREFGARQEDRRFYADEGYLDFVKFAASAQFRDGVDKVLAGMERGYVFALMCAEKDPISCHRAILVGREFSKLGLSVTHLMPGGATQSQEELDARLLETFFPDREQMSLFGGGESEAELIDRAYGLQNAAIGYRLEEENG